MNKVLFLLMFLAAPLSVVGADPDTDKTDADDAAKPQEEVVAQTDTGPKTMSGMSILGNEETPKSLVIVPWKSSELGDDIGLTDSLGENAQPVDKEVFLRELEYFEIRSSE
ncbi:MAG: hypothetical protein OEW73_12325 [Gammaproteobacteria bacterium]|jgi:hypothetical protein|nr:hypothetical protein [Gammaproteobacteria bacterium]MDH5241561.1 hypothetical protein [Gammaproteobacteria bacterium]MDH5262641.1 hypothetical protein [Gammaproteobacteria bacterium]MDH5584326.1 hypothetical protein [Gammaproteobacteria bacterium]